MGWILICIIVAAIGIIFAVCTCSDFWEEPGIALSILGIAGLVISLIIVGCTQGFAGQDFAKMEYERSALEYRLKSEGLEGNEMLHSDIIEFNKSLYTQKFHVHKFMTGWFVNSRIADGIDYIDIGEGVIPNEAY